MKESTESLEEEAPVSEAEKIQLLDMRHSQEMLEDNLLELKVRTYCWVLAKDSSVAETESRVGDGRTGVNRRRYPHACGRTAGTAE